MNVTLARLFLLECNGYSECSPASFIYGMIQKVRYLLGHIMCDRSVLKYKCHRITAFIKLKIGMLEQIHPCRINV